eukprot:320448_1
MTKKTEQLLQNHLVDDLNDVNLDDDEQKEDAKHINGAPTFNEYEDSEDADNEEEEDEKYPIFRQISYSFNEHESIWDDDMLPSAGLAFLFMICVIISYIGYTENKNNKYLKIPNYAFC